MEYYVYPDRTTAEMALAAINGSGWFPITPSILGFPADESIQKTTCWITNEQIKELLTGEFAIPRIPVNRLDHIGVSQEEREVFMAAYGQDIRDLQTSDFVDPFLSISSSSSGSA